MRLNRLFWIALVTATFAVVGCGDNNNNNASDVCNGCDNQSLRGACERTYNLCIQDDLGGEEDCAVAALLTCGVV